MSDLSDLSDGSVRKLRLSALKKPPENLAALFIFSDANASIKTYRFVSLEKVAATPQV